MNEIKHDHITDAQLLAFNDGELDAATTELITRTPGLLARAAQLTRLEAGLQGQLYRATCLDSQQLMEYVADLSPAGVRTNLSAHINDCPHCSREVAELRAYRAAVAADLTPGLLTQLKGLVARLVPALPNAGEAWGLGMPQLAGVRGAMRGADAGPMLYEAGEWQVSLEVQDDAARPGQRQLLGLILGAESTGWYVHVLQAARPVATAVVDELGNFVLTHLPAGTYELLISGPDTSLQLPDFVIQ
ncbi:MAG: hypothetical protein H6666_03780 [Ardenticatenaceae bacterium]|nr:hypothetical protein [Anaerolineales bacterium]MCB8917023.1 hypothetical protein [Ardenticatenaceae bacterium]